MSDLYDKISKTFTINHIEIERRRYERGKLDAEYCFPPREFSRSYRDGYAVGRQPGQATWWGSRD